MKFSEIQTKFAHQPEASFSVPGFIKYSLTLSAWQTFIPPNLCLLLLRPPILKISIVSFSSNLN